MLSGTWQRLGDASPKSETSRRLNLSFSQYSASSTDLKQKRIDLRRLILQTARGLKRRKWRTI
jgi:hypothetical protein